MKTIALSTILLLVACKSPTAVIDDRSFQCGPGQDIELRAGLEDPMGAMEGVGRPMFLVEVANNSDHDVTVESVSIDPRGPRDPGVIKSFQKVDQLIPEGEDHVFRIPVTEFGRMDPGGDPMRVYDRPFEFLVTVKLANGDAYRCVFETARPR